MPGAISGFLLVAAFAAAAAFGALLAVRLAVASAPGKERSRPSPGNPPGGPGKP